MKVSLPKKALLALKNLALAPLRAIRYSFEGTIKLFGLAAGHPFEKKNKGGLILVGSIVAAGAGVGIGIGALTSLSLPLMAGLGAIGLLPTVMLGASSIFALLRVPAKTIEDIKKLETGLTPPTLASQLGNGCLRGDFNEKPAAQAPQNPGTGNTPKP